MRIQNIFDPNGLDDPNGECPAKEVKLIQRVKIFISLLKRSSSSETRTGSLDRVSSLEILGLPMSPSEWVRSSNIRGEWTG